MDSLRLLALDSIAQDAIRQKVFPGCQVLVAKDNKIVYDKSFGYATYDSSEAVFPQMMYDMASCTKISATTLAIMKLYETHALQLTDTIGKFLPWTLGTDKARLTIHDILLHQAGFVPYIPFYKMTQDSLGQLEPHYYSDHYSVDYDTEVTPRLFVKSGFSAQIDSAIVASKLAPSPKYVYSDNDFIILERIVHQLTGESLDQYVYEHFYHPLGMDHSMFQPLLHNIDSLAIAPTEDDTLWRHAQVRGTVHDPGAALMGGVAGHAGLFSDADDLSILYRMLLNGGEWNGKRYLKKSTIKKFTSYNSLISRRGLGFDKPEKDNLVSKEKYPYPSRFASSATFGHTGFTGTCIWADPKNDLLFILLSNRVYPSAENWKIVHLKIREKMLDAVYEANR